MKKVFLFLILAGLLFTDVFAASGSLSGEKELRVVKTEWFDIIYPKRCERTASILYENADRIYYEVTEQYGIKPSFRMPVVITPAVEKLNAYWTISPYNHIVIYDTSVTDLDDLNVFSETFLSVFSHEVTHAVTFNMKNGFWKFFSSVFGDIATPGFFLINSGIAEGAAVSSESSKGEGRLNNEYAKQYVKQAKIEDDFPGFYDAFGSRDVVPTGANYYFNGAFHQYLQEKYGLEAYAKFWYNLVNLNSLSVEGCFKKAFKVSTRIAWKYFINSYSVPSVPANPVEAGLVKDFFNPSSSAYSIYNNSGSLFSNLTESSKGIFWIDSLTSTIQYVEKDDLEEALQNISALKPKTLLSHNRISSFTISPDDRFLLFSYTSEEAATIKTALKLYDFESESFIKIKETGLKNAEIVMSGNDYYLVADKYENFANETFIARIDFQKNKKISLEDVKTISSPYAGMKFDYKNYADGQFACIKKTGTKYAICICDLDGKELALYEMPEEKMVVRSLSVKDGNIYFSFAIPDSMPRLGKLDISKNQFELINQDLSGGVYEPLSFGDYIVYSGVFFRQNRILLLPSQNDFPHQTYDIASSAKSELLSSEQKTDVLSALDSYELNSKKYNSLNYLRHGIFIPASLYSTSYFGRNAVYTSSTQNYFVGLSYITANPWTDGSNDLFILTGGWNYLNGGFGLEFLSQKGTDTSLFSSTIDGKVEFDKEGFKLTYGKMQQSFMYPFGRHSYAGISNTIEGGYGRQDARNKNLQSYHEFLFWLPKYQNIVAPQDDKKFYTVQDIVTLKYTNVHKAGTSRMEKAGVTAAVSVGYRKDASIEENPVKYIDAFALSAGFKGYIPRLIPLTCYNGFVYNLPTKVDFTLLPSNSILGYTEYIGDTGRVVFDLYTETVLFGMEIQKALPLIHWFYANNFYVSAGYALSAGASYYTQSGFQGAHLMTYAGNLFSGRGCFLDSAYLKITMEATPNIGPFAKSSLKMSIFSLTSVSFRKNLKNPVYSTFGIQASF